MRKRRVLNHINDRRERGVAAVEFALVLVFLLLLVAGIVEFGRAFWYYDALTKATRDGARMLSVANKDAFTSVIGDAKTLVAQVANAANMQPPLTSANVTVTCLDASFTEMGCGSGIATPRNVRVAITSYSIDIGGMIPFLSPGGRDPSTHSAVVLSPRTTMPYMN